MESFGAWHPVKNAKVFPVEFKLISSELHEGEGRRRS
jgi:hypothetical protein